MILNGSIIESAGGDSIYTVDTAGELTVGGQINAIACGAIRISSGKCVINENGYIRGFRDNGWKILNQGGNLQITGGTIDCEGGVLRQTGNSTFFSLSGGTITGNSSEYPTVKLESGVASLTGGAIINEGGGLAISKDASADCTFSSVYLLGGIDF